MTDKLTDLRGKFFVVEDAAVTDYNLTPYEGWLYIVMLKHANRSTGELFPSVQTLVRETQMSKAQALRCTKSLEAKGLIRVTRDNKKNGKDRAVNHYFILQATRYLVDTDPGISQTPTPVSTGNLNQNHFEPEKTLVPNGTDGDAKLKKQREPNPIFDAVAQYVFEIAPGELQDEGGRIGILASWLSGKSDGAQHGKTRVTVGFISAPAKPEHIIAFAGYWKSTSKANIPYDLQKFVDAWRKWVSGLKQNGVRRVQQNGVAVPEMNLSGNEVEARKQQLAAARKGEQPQ